MTEYSQISERKKEVLNAIISDFIYTAGPVSSSSIRSRYMTKLSPATIRHEMAELEAMGFLYQPHTSAGRVPTDRGFRIYVDHLMKLKKLQTDDKQEISRFFNNAGHELYNLIKDVSRFLSGMSHHTSLAVVHSYTDVVLKRIDLIRLSVNKVLVVLVSQAGIVQHKPIETDENLSQEELNKMSMYLNEILTGLTLTLIRKKIFQEMKEEKNRYDKLLKKALLLGSELLGKQEQENMEVFIEGQSRFFEYPEFLQIERMKDIFRAFEEKSRILSVLEKTLHTPGIQVFIGCETGSYEFNDCSLITATYGIGSGICGSIGIIGPMRMDYSRIIPIVDYTASIVEKMFREG